MKIKLRTLFLSVVVFVFCAVTYAEANIVIRSLVVNTSASQKRKIPFKAYLPKEIKPENVVDAGDLEIAFDPKEGTYFVFKDYELDPKQVVTVEIELEDVWMIPAGELSGLREEAGKLTKILANTDYYERANYLKNSIESKLNQVEQTQSVTNPNPGGYISDFRENLKLMESVKADLAAARTLVAQAKNLAPMVTWKLVIAIVAFLGLLGLIFFFVWQRQIRSLANLAEDYEGSAAEAAAKGRAADEGERRQAKEEKKAGLTDIEERLKEK